MSLKERKLAAEENAQHRIEWTRRDLLSHGIFGYAAFMAAPLSIGFLPRKIMAAPQELPRVPFICFDMAGGAALPGNFLVGKQGGPDDYLQSYSTLGWSPTAAQARIDRRYGLPMAQDVSGIFAGMTETMSPGAQKNLRLGSVCHFSQLDSGENRQNIASLVFRLGLDGQIFPAGLSSIRGLSGGLSASADILAVTPPTFFNSIDHLKSALIFGGGFLNHLSTSDLHNLQNLVKHITGNQLSEFMREGNFVTLKAKVDEFLASESSSSNIDPRDNGTAKAIWQINESSVPGSEAVVQATISSCVIDGHSGPGVWTLGGCDYHGGASALADEKDATMGRAIGRAVEYAHQKGKPLFFQLITDGSCDSVPGTRYWVGDTNEGLQVFGYYDPDRVPEYVSSSMQIGHFNDAQAAERQTLVGADPRKAALATFANYCAVQGRLGEFVNFDSTFTRAELNSLLVFAEG